MKKEIKQKRKSLNTKYADFLYEVLKYVQSMNLSKFAFYALRDEIIEDVYEAQVNQESTDYIYHHGYKNHFEKKTRNLPKKGILEKIGGFLFAFFTLFFALALFTYIYRFSIKDGTFYSKGIYLFVTPSNIGTMLIYGFLGAIVSIFIQKNDKKTKNIMLIGTSIVGVIAVVTFYAIGAYVSNMLKLNMIIVLLVCVILAIGGIFLEYFISKKKVESKTK